MESVPNNSDNVKPAADGLPIDFSAHLSDADAAAIDAMFERGLDDSAAAGDARTAKISALFGLLRGEEPLADATLADVTILRCLRSVPAIVDQHSERTGVAASAESEATLSQSDRDAMDSWMASGFDADRTPAALRERARKHEALVALATSVDAVGRDDLLIERTMQRVRGAGAAPVRERVRGFALPSWSLADVGSLAAMLLLSASVLWPLLSSVRHQSGMYACAGNLADTAMAIGQYAADYRDSLPVASASLGSGRWWDVSARSEHSNSSNLFTLPSSGYMPLSTLACSGNANAYREDKVDPGQTDWRNLDEVSYSYQIMFGPQRPVWEGSGGTQGRAAKTDRSASGVIRVVLTDRSPVVLRAVRGEVIDPLENSPNHSGAGQSVLSSDGSVTWTRSPELADGDNLWLPRAMENLIRQVENRPKLEGNELPENTDDAFVGP